MPCSTNGPVIGHRFGGDFPLGLGGQSRPGPAGEGVGLEEADVADRLGVDHGPEARVSVWLNHWPSCSIQYIGARQSSALAVASPADSQQLARAVPAVGHELLVLAVVDQSVTQLERLEVDLVAGGLVVEGEGVAGVADLADRRRRSGPTSS